LILPEGKTSKTIKSVVSLLLVVVIVQPILRLKDANFSLGQVFDEEVVLQNDYLEYIHFKKVEHYEKTCISLLEKLGVYQAEVDVIYEIDDNNEINLKKIQINLKNSVIKSDKDHIDIIDEAKLLIKNTFKIDEAQIDINE
jgi:hypothetical protein